MWRAWAAGGGSAAGADPPEGSSVPAWRRGRGEPTRRSGLIAAGPVPANGPTAAWSALVQSAMVTSGSSNRTAAATGIAAAGSRVRVSVGQAAPGSVQHFPGPGLPRTRSRAQDCRNPAPAHDSSAPLRVWPPGSQTGHSAPLGHGDLATGRQRIVGDRNLQGRCTGLTECDRPRNSEARALPPLWAASVPSAPIGCGVQIRSIGALRPFAEHLEVDRIWLVCR
jgi:hypothetical protein